MPLPPIIRVMEHKWLKNTFKNELLLLNTNGINMDKTKTEHLIHIYAMPISVFLKREKTKKKKKYDLYKS